jgi:hypothetical protein
MHKWGEQRRHLQSQDGQDVMLRRANTVCPQCGAELFPFDEELELVLGGLTSHTQGWPIGIEMVESGNKPVVEACLKGAGMNWERPSVNPMLGLHNIVFRDRWAKEWPLIANQLRQQARERAGNSARNVAW